MNNWINAHERLPRLYGKYFIKYGDNINGKQNLYKDVMSLQELIYTLTKYDLVEWLEDEESKTAIPVKASAMNKIKLLASRPFYEDLVASGEKRSPGRPKKYE